MNPKTFLFLFAAAVSWWNSSVLAQDTRTNAREDSTDSWQEVRQKDTIEAYEQFLTGHFGHLPAERRLRELRYQRGLQTGQIADWIAFYNSYGLVRLPGDDQDVEAMKAAAKDHLKRALHEELLRAPSVELCQKYSDLPRSGLTEHKCYCLMQDEEFERARTSNGRFPFALYVAKCPEGRYVREANDRLASLRDPERCASISDIGDRRACYSTYGYFVHDLDDGSLLNRIAEAFGLPKEYPWVKSRVSPKKGEEALTKEQVADKERLIESYLTFMRTGFFEKAREYEVQLQQYGDYLSRQDFYQVAEKLYIDQPESQGNLEFIFFPSFYRKVYSAVVRTLGAQYAHFEWPLGVYDLEQGRHKYYVVVMTLSVPRKLILLGSNVKVLDAVDDRGGLGTLGPNFTVTERFSFADGNLLAIHSHGNCVCSRFYSIVEDRLRELKVIISQGKEVYYGPGAEWFCDGCGRVGISKNCEFTKDHGEHEELVCRGHSIADDGRHRVWRAAYEWNSVEKAFLEKSYEAHFE